MKVHDSRRLTGPNLLTDRPAAVLDVALTQDADPDREAETVARWRRQATRMLEAVDWSAQLFDRSFPGGLSVALQAPIDALYAATEINEWAWAAAVASGPDAADGEAPEPFEAARGRLLETIAEERNPALLALAAEADARGTPFLSDDDVASVGLGTGSRSWPVSRLPAAGEVPWESCHAVPVALITGTNGKTTTVRLLASIARAAGHLPGVSSTDWIAAGNDVLDRGDYSGPGGARQVLRDRRVEIAFLETARGGMLRRGLAVSDADVGLVTNVAADHLGEFGIHDLEAIAGCKFLVAKAARHLVLNLDDPVVRRRGLEADHGRPVTWFSVQPTAGPAATILAEHLEAGGRACVLERGRLLLKDADRSVALAEIAEIPIALGGAARHNVANALAAAGVAWLLGLDPRSIAEGLRRFESTPDTNPGRLNLFDFNGARLVVDFAHNPHGIDALLTMAAELPASRRLISIGQAGDRDDESILELARTAWRARPDRILVKELSEYLRGRAEGEVAELLETELRRLGAGDDHLARAATELDAAGQALDWLQPGDLALLIVHSGRDEVLDLLRQRGATAG